MLFAELVAAAQQVRATSSRTAKTTILAELIARLAPDEIVAAVSWLMGQPVQRTFGTGWRTLSAVGAPPVPEAQVPIAQVQQALDELSQVAGEGSLARRNELLGSLMSRFTADEQDHFIRLILGDLRQGALVGVVTDAVARAGRVSADRVRRAAMFAGSVPVVANALLVRGPDALDEFGLQVGRPVLPMLASPAGSVAEAVSELGAVSVEYKLDGARVQIHRTGDDVAVFTRTLRDITAATPELVALARELPVRSVVLDGEAMGWHAEPDGDGAARPMAFQDTMSNVGAGQLRAAFFDCLHLDGQDLLDEPLRARLDALEVAVGAHRIPAVLSPAAADAEQHYARALAAGHEGVMVKALDSAYAAGRRGKAWRKVKPVHTLDLIVLGAEWGYGRRTGKLSNLHLGARDPDGGPPIMVGKTFKGLTDRILAWQTSEFPKYETRRDATTVYVRPEIVVEIALDSAQRSTRYPGGVALRFARVVRYRPDKAAADADTIDAVRALLP